MPDATVSIMVVPCPPVKRYHLFAPSTVRPGQSFVAVALPVDINGNAIPAMDLIDLAAPGGTVSEICETDAHTFHADITLSSPGIARLQLTDRTHGITALSNPIRVSSSSGHNVYWGEFHWHGYDGVELNVLNQDTHPDKAYCYGRDVTRLDLCAMGSHIFRHSPGAVFEWWELYREAAYRHDEPGRYVTFLGCEWRDREREGGDRSLVWKDLDALPPDPTWKIEQMYARFRGQPVLIIPHVGGAIAMPYRHDPELETLCEMTSGHGNFEWFAQAN